MRERGKNSPILTAAIFQMMMAKLVCSRRFLGGVSPEAVFTSLNVAFVPISRSRFKQRQIPPLRTFINVLRFCVNFWMIFGHFVNEIFFPKDRLN